METQDWQLPDDAFYAWCRTVSGSRYPTTRSIHEGAVVAFDCPTGRGCVNVDGLEFTFFRDEFKGAARDPLPGEVVSVTLYDDRVERVTAHWEDA